MNEITETVDHFPFFPWLFSENEVKEEKTRPHGFKDYPSPYIITARSCASHAIPLRRGTVGTRKLKSSAVEHETKSNSPLHPPALHGEDGRAGPENDYYPLPLFNRKNLTTLYTHTGARARVVQIYI